VSAPVMCGTAAGGFMCFIARLIARPFRLERYDGAARPLSLRGDYTDGYGRICRSGGIGAEHHFYAV
jgi:hypothetical protein